MSYPKVLQGCQPLVRGVNDPWYAVNRCQLVWTQESIGRPPARSLWAVAGRARSPLTHDVADGRRAPSADVPFGSDFVKVPILRDMELGQTG